MSIVIVDGTFPAQPRGAHSAFPDAAFHDKQGATIAECGQFVEAYGHLTSTFRRNQLIISVRSSQFDEFEEGMRGVNGRHLLVARSTLEWNLNVIDLDDVKVMDGRNGGNSLYQGACLSDTFAMFVPVSQAQRPMVNGKRLDQESVAWLSPAEEFSIPSTAGLSWLGFMINLGHVLRWLDGVERLGPQLQSFCTGRTNAADIERAVMLALRAREVAANVPDALSHPLARDSLRDQLLDAVFSALRSLETDNSVRHGRPRLGRREILRRVLALMEERIDQPIQVGVLCREVSVSVATLQNVFAEQFGVSPHRYLMLHRLHAIHASLRKSGASDTVSSVCTRFGVWDFGRFATQYRRHFGVSPSQTLGGRQALSAQERGRTPRG